MDFEPRDLSDARERDSFEVHELRWGDCARSGRREPDIESTAAFFRLGATAQERQYAFHVQ